MIYCVSFFTVFFVGTAVDLGCGPEPDPYDYYVTFFHNNLQKTDGYRPFYFSGYTFLNGDTYEAENDNKAAEKDINVKEWMAYLGVGVTYKDISCILYETNRKTDSLFLWDYPRYKGKLPDSLKNNSFIKRLAKRKNAMAYVALSKKAEPLVNITDYDRWLVTHSDKNMQHTFALKYIEMAATAHNGFLELRCFYQAQRLFHYGRYFKEAADLYDKRIKNFKSKSHVKYWALDLKAGEEEQLGHNEQAAYLYSKVFALCPERRVQAYFDFLYTKVLVPKVIKLAKNRHEKAIIYAIKGFRNPRIGLGALNNVYNIDPGSELVSVLLAREINKVEEHYLTPRFNGTKYYDSIGFWDHDKYDSVKSYYIKYIPRLKAFCARLATEHKYPESALGYLGSAYLSWVTGDTMAGLDTLNRIEDSRVTGKLYDEKQLIKLLLLSQNIQKLDMAAENKLLPSLTWLEKKVKQERLGTKTSSKYWGDYDMNYYLASSRDFYSKVLARMYLKQKDTAMAALCILKSEKTLLTAERWEEDPGLGFDMPYFWQTAMHSYHFTKILSWDRAPNKRAYLKLLMSDLHLPTLTTITRIEGSHLKNIEKRPEQTVIPAIYDLLGTACLREHKYSAAVKAFKHVGATKLNYSVGAAFANPSRYANPFIDRLSDYPLTYQGAIDNKLTFAMAMAKLQKQIKHDPKRASRYYYKMACGLYNTSYYGSAWYYTAYGWANADIAENAKLLYYNADYLEEATAQKYFLKARSLSNDMEFKARCTFMAAKCRQKQIQFPADYRRYLAGKKYDFDGSSTTTRKYDKSTRQNPYFKSLNSTYAKTAFHKLAVSDCSYFRDFLTSIGKTDVRPLTRETRPNRTR